MTGRARATGPELPGLFDVPEPCAPRPASMQFAAEAAALVSEVLTTTEGDRHDVAARLSRLVGRDIAKATLDGWSAESREAYNLPFYMVPALEAACETHALTRWLANKRGARLLVGEVVEALHGIERTVGWGLMLVSVTVFITAAIWRRR